MNLEGTRKQEGDIQDPYDLRGVTLKLLLFVAHISLSWLLILTNKKTALATQGTDKVTAKITYMLLFKIVTDKPIKSPNFYR